MNDEDTPVRAKYGSKVCYVLPSELRCKICQIFLHLFAANNLIPNVVVRKVKGLRGERAVSFIYNLPELEDAKKRFEQTDPSEQEDWIVEWQRRHDEIKKVSQSYAQCSSLHFLTISHVHSGYLSVRSGISHTWKHARQPFSRGRK